VRNFNGAALLTRILFQMAYSDAEILQDEQFSVFVGDSPSGAEGEELHAHVLVKLSNSGRLKVYHKLACGGSYNLECRFGVADIIEAESLRRSACGWRGPRKSWNLS
jgi:hypothetical protein